MKILITGGLGFIGSHTVDALIADGHHPVIADDGSVGHRDNIAHLRDDQYSQIIPGDVTLIDERFLYGSEISGIIHLAAQPSLLASWNDPLRDAEVNAMGTLKLLLAAKHVGIRKFIFASTSAVYAATQRPPFSENHSYLRPDRPYGISKLAAELYVRTIIPTSVVLRYGNVYGPRQVPVGENQIVPRFLSHVYGNQKFEIYGDGEQTRDFVYVNDIANANVTALLSTQSGVFNVSRGEASSVNQIITHLMKHTGYSGKINHVARPENEPDEVLLDVSRAHAFLHWKAHMDLESGLAETVKWWEQNKVK